MNTTNIKIRFLCFLDEATMKSFGWTQDCLLSLCPNDNYVCAFFLRDPSLLLIVGPINSCHGQTENEPTELHVYHSTGLARRVEHQHMEKKKKIANNNLSQTKNNNNSHQRLFSSPFLFQSRRKKLL